MIFKFINLMDKWLEKATSHTLVVTILVMLLFSVFSIVIRFFNFSFLWMEPFVRHLVFLSIFLGGIVATGKGTHIGIDIIGKYLEGKGLHSVKSFVSFISNTISFITLFWLSYASIGFIKVEQEFGKEVFFGIHSSVLVMIIPVGFSLIATRFMVASLNYFNKSHKNHSQGTQHA
jgi:TRAP-type C4-dicarboxylate transport system permease small subunit